MLLENGPSARRPQPAVGLGVPPGVLVLLLLLVPWAAPAAGP
jgi:hypothetical protein